MSTTSTPTIIVAMFELAKQAWHNDQDAIAELRRAGELLALAGGFDAMDKVHGLLHDYQISHRPSQYDLVSMISSCWDSIPEWANA